MKVVTFGEIMLRLKTPEHCGFCRPEILKQATEEQKPTWLCL